MDSQCAQIAFGVLLAYSVLVTLTAAVVARELRRLASRPAPPTLDLERECTWCGDMADRSHGKSSYGRAMRGHLDYWRNRALDAERSGALPKRLTHEQLTLWYRYDHDLRVWERRA